MKCLQLAALCCLYLAYLTGAEKLTTNRGYNYQPPTPAFSSLSKRPHSRPQTSFIPPKVQQPFPTVQSSYIPPSQSHVRPKFPQEAPTHSQFQPPSYSKPRPVYSTPQAEEKPMPFGYGYGVNDEFNGIDFGHNTNSDGHVTTGEYRVLLPDGRTQIVSYKVDDNNGYQADVTYEGEARPYEPPSPSYQRPQQTYEEPQQTYVAPQQTYVPPQQTYVAPQQSYVAPQPQTSYIPPKTVQTPDTLYRADF
ncbi:Insect cuticle protein [Trinorchestia longiramus]|nr:Insect cuticle protein [Trinorchestia longiramus]